MSVVRGIAIFLVGLGTAIGAHFAGLFDGIPYRLHRQTYLSDLTPPDVPPGTVIDMQSPPGVLPEGGAAVLHVTYRPSRHDAGTGCVPRYAFYNHTGRQILFSAHEDRDSADRIDSGAAYSPVADNLDDAYAGDDDRDPCRGGVVSIRLDDPPG